MRAALYGVELGLADWAEWDGLRGFWGKRRRKGLEVD